MKLKTVIKKNKSLCLKSLREGVTALVCVVYLKIERVWAVHLWVKSLERIGRISSYCRTVNLLIPRWMAFLTMPPLTVSLSWSTVFIPYLYRLHRAIPRVGRGHGGGRTPGMGFSSNSTPDFSDNTMVPWASPPSMGFNSNKGLVATGASLSGQIMLSVSPRLVEEWECLASLKLKENFPIWKCVWSQSNQSWPEFASTFVLSWVFKLTSIHCV